jgi:hypothetical protein
MRHHYKEKEYDSLKMPVALLYDLSFGSVFPTNPDFQAEFFAKCQLKLMILVTHL